MMRRALRSKHHHSCYGFDDGFFFSVSPFAVTAAPEVGDVLVTFGPSVECPLESVTPDCDWLGAPPLVRELPLSPIFEPPVALDPVPVPPLVLAPLLMLEPLVLDPLLMPVLDPLLMPVLEPLLMEPVLSVDAGATEPPAIDVSVVFALLLLLHAATATRVARIAMRFMKSSVEILSVSAARHSARQCTRVLGPLGGNKRTPKDRMRKGRNQSVAPSKPHAEAGYGFFIFIDVSFFIVESVFVVVVVVVDDIALSCFVVSIMAGAGLMAGAATTAVSAGAESLALHAAIARTAATTARRFIENSPFGGGMWSTLRPSTSVVAMPGASGG
jgi:hypothetical protein